MIDIWMWWVLGMTVTAAIMAPRWHAVQTKTKEEFSDFEKALLPVTFFFILIWPIFLPLLLLGRVRSWLQARKKDKDES